MLKAKADHINKSNAQKEKKDAAVVERMLELYFFTAMTKAEVKDDDVKS